MRVIDILFRWAAVCSSIRSSDSKYARSLDGLTGVVGFRIERAEYRVDVGSGQLVEVAATTNAWFDCDFVTLLDMYNGTISPQVAVETERLKVSGDTELFLRFSLVIYLATITPAVQSL